MKEHVFVFFVHLKSGLCLSLGKTMQCDDMTVVSSVSLTSGHDGAALGAGRADQGGQGDRHQPRHRCQHLPHDLRGQCLLLQEPGAGCGQCLCTGDPPASCLLDRLLITARHNTAAGHLPTRTYGEKKLSLYSIHY